MMPEELCSKDQPISSRFGKEVKFGDVFSFREIVAGSIDIVKRLPFVPFEPVTPGEAQNGNVNSGFLI